MLCMCVIWQLIFAVVAHHFSSGRSGDDLTCCGCVESLPGPGYPPWPAASAAHARNRFLLCALCNCLITAAEWRSMRKLLVAELPAAAAAWFAQQVPSYSALAPVALCSRCRIYIGRSERPDALTAMAASAAARFAAADDRPARRCDGTACWLCRRVASLLDGTAAATAAASPTVAAPDAAASAGRAVPLRAVTRSVALASEVPLSGEIPPMLRSPWGRLHGRDVASITAVAQAAVEVTPAQFVTADDYVAVYMDTTLTGRQTGTIAAKLQRRFQARDQSAISAGMAVVRRDISVLHTIFAAHFRAVPVPRESHVHTSDGMVHCCVELGRFVEHLVWILGQHLADIRIVKISADDGGGSLKVSLQLVFADDPLFSDSETSTTRAQRQRRSDERLATGVQRTYVLALAHGCKESFESVRLVFDLLPWSQLLDLLPVEAQVVLPVDMKMAATVLGIGSVGSANPVVWSMWSPFTAHSQPSVRRTVAGVLQQNSKRDAAPPRSNAERNTLFRRHESVHCAPIELLQHPRLCELPLLDVLVPPQLHIVLGIVLHLWELLDVIDAQVAIAWMRVVGVSHSRPHGARGFDGNSCTAVAAALQAFHLVMARTMSVKLHPEWRQSISAFEEAYADLVTFVELFAPRQQYRDPERLTPKIYCLVRELPTWIDQHQCTLLSVSEQAFETLHWFYALHEQNWKIPSTGMRPETLVECNHSAKIARRLADKHPLDDVHTPSDGTRGGGARGRKRRRADTASLVAVSQVDPKFIKMVGGSRRSPLTPTPPSHSSDEKGAPLLLFPNIDNAIRQRQRSLVAFVANRLPDQFVVQSRIEETINWQKLGGIGIAPWRSYQVRIIVPTWI